MKSALSTDTTSKPLTIQKVRATLRKAGFPAMKRHTTAVPGWYNYTPGSTVRERHGEGFVIEWDGMNRLTRGKVQDEERSVKLAGMLSALVCAGMDASIETLQYGNCVVVKP